MLTKTEQDFTRLVRWLKDECEIPNPQSILHHLLPQSIPSEFRDSFEFYMSLSGPSRNRLYRVALGRGIRKGPRLPPRRRKRGCMHRMARKETEHEQLPLLPIF